LGENLKKQSTREAEEEREEASNHSKLSPLLFKLWIGIGCQRGTIRKTIEMAIAQVFRENHLSEKAIAGISTIDTKALEPGLLELCQIRNWLFKTWTPSILSSVCVPNPSQIVGEKAGTYSVAEAAAILAVSDQPVTQEDFESRLLVPKQIFRSPEKLWAVTVAVAKIPYEYVD
jgi:cobalt-precorrin 5A hydrolase